MSFTFYLFDRDAWSDPQGMLRDDNNTGDAGVGNTITLMNPSEGQVVTVNGNGIADSQTVASGLSEQYSISGVTFGPGTSIEMDYGFVVRDENGIDYFIGKVKVSNTTDTRYNGSIMTQGWDAVANEWVGPPFIGSTLTLISVDDSTYPGAFNPWQRGDQGVRDGPTDFDPYSNDVRLGEGVAAPVLDTGFFPICFTAGTLIETEQGLRAVETLVAGDKVLTRDDGLQPLIWVGRRQLSERELRSTPKWRPIRIAANALGDGLPRRDVEVSPQHRVLVRSRIAQRMFDTEEVLVAAKELVAMPDIDRADDLTEVTYFHLMFDTHQIVFAEGAEMESLFIGPMTLATFDSAARREVVTLMPQITSVASDPARPILRGGPARGLLRRHERNDRPLVETPEQVG